MSKLRRLFDWLLRTGARAAEQRIREEIGDRNANPGNKAKKSPLRVVK